MDHDSSAMRIAAFCVLSIVGYWAYISYENYDPGQAVPTRIGEASEPCSKWAAIFGMCQQGASYVRANGVKSLSPDTASD
ncbi:MAG: hypothetical protein AAF762_08365 [Pseudomonadota bacterium]